MGELSLQKMMAWVQAGQILMSAGVATVRNIRAWITSSHAAMTEDQLNQICEAIIEGAVRHQALADGDAGKS